MIIQLTGSHGSFFSVQYMHFLEPMELKLYATVQPRLSALTERRQMTRWAAGSAPAGQRIGIIRVRCIRMPMYVRGVSCARTREWG